jgi:hypothetical protein
MSLVVVLLVSLAAGAVLGVVLGFSLASHNDVLRGVRPNTNNRLIVFLARPTSEMRGSQAVIFLLLMLVWLVVFFGLLAVPALAAQHLAGEGPPLHLPAYGVAAVAWWLGSRFGANAWKTIS